MSNPICYFLCKQNMFKLKHCWHLSCRVPFKRTHALKVERHSTIIPNWLVNTVSSRVCVKHNIHILDTRYQIVSDTKIENYIKNMNTFIACNSAILIIDNISISLIVCMLFIVDLCFPVWQFVDCWLVFPSLTVCLLLTCVSQFDSLFMRLSKSLTRRNLGHKLI